MISDDLGVLRETPEQYGEPDYKVLYLQEKKSKEDAVAEKEDVRISDSICAKHRCLFGIVSEQWKKKYNVLMDEYQLLRKENQSNDLLLDASQKENIKCMSDITRYVSNLHSVPCGYL